MSRQRLQALAAFLAVIEKLARVGWHGLRRLMTAVRTGEHGFDLHAGSLVGQGDLARLNVK